MRGEGAGVAQWLARCAGDPCTESDYRGFESRPGLRQAERKGHDCLRFFEPTLVHVQNSR